MLREVLVDKENCVLCRQADLNSWAKTIKKIADRREWRDVLGGRAREQFLERHTWRQRAELVLGGLV